jgi:phenylalanyl-tRNA synthetase beta chain
MMANSLTTASIKPSDALKEEHNVTMLNPLSNDDLATMRHLCYFSGPAISYNINRKNGNLKLFEFGKSYHKFLSDLKSINI